jgi:hypothetical protein
MRDFDTQQWFARARQQPQALSIAQSGFCSA